MATLPKKEVRISRGAFTARTVQTSEWRSSDPHDPKVPRRLGDLLVACHVITAEQLQKALAFQQARGGFLGKALVAMEFIDTDTLVAFLAKQTNIPHLNLTEYQIQREVLDLLPVEFCRERLVVAIDKLGSMLTIAMVNPLDLATLEDIRGQYPQLRIKPMLCSWEHLERVLDRRAPREPKEHDPLGLTPMAKHEEPAPIMAVENPEPPALDEPELTHDAAPSETTELSADESPGAEPQVFPPEVDVNSPVISEVVESPQVPTSETNQPVPSPLERQPEITAPAPNRSIIVPAADVAFAIAEDATNWIDAFFGDDSSDEAAEAACDAPAPAIQEVAPLLNEDVRHQAQPPQPAEPIKVSAAAEAVPMNLADVVRESIRDAVGMVAQAIRERDHDSPPSAQELSGSLRGAVYAAVKGLGDRVSSESVLDAVGDDFPEIQAATQQALREAEAVVVAEARLHELESAHRRKQIPFGLPRYHSVHPLGDATQACLPQETDGLVMSALESERPLEEYRFDDYFVDKSNAFTFSLCRAVAEKPGRDYNPFFLYGSVGVGKTHLINAIGNFIQSRDQKARVGYVSAIFFASRLGDAVQDGAVKAFRDNYCHWDVLILDDMQFLAGRVEAQEEFFHIFNALHQAGRQIIIAGDQAPDRLGLLEERLVSRFSGGIVAHLRPPNYDTRMDILRHHVRLRNVSVPDDVLAFLAQQITNDVRKLTGSLRKVLAFADLVGQDITLDMATDILGHLGVAEAV